MSIPRPAVHIIYNPVKVKQFYKLRRLVTLRAREIGASEPVWWETTPENPGTEQAAKAAAQGASLVVVVGGDGTVRAVAAGLAHTEVPLGILPLGTGNLLARNLNIPTDNLLDAVDLAFFGQQRRFDISWLRVSKVGEPSSLPPEGGLLPTWHKENLLKRGIQPAHPQEYAFMAIAGQGWDAQLMADTSTTLKQHMGWGAYVVAGAQALRAPQIRTNLRLDFKTRLSVQGRSVLFANCSTLIAGLLLVPQAKLDDGLLDVTVLSAKKGLIGWLNLFTKIAAQGAGIRQETLPGTTGELEFLQAKRAHSSVSMPQPVQVDGDAIGSAKVIDVRVDKQALVIRHG
ncbi:diacylglycerol kinase catalytic domain protein [Gleimia coleocanis DSM 15436]|uniref:Diacylglycerol kinase catalytic domain protein n=1 Tax=Gleimia coleocanis DSM 15436 TaxID=525245 RepID=C0VY65_9ACTO|nr:diacylglycerol kinase family protein [Gleimia coleocanis]EEH64368.1 diacylglycerol kinase catalytic domain protein [Gleimia coleocanis DSM 15436]